MARKQKKQNEEVLLQAYNAVCRKYSLDSSAPVNEQVHIIIEKADRLQTKICQKADSIKIDAYQHIKEDYPELGIPKSVWLELVNLRRLQRHTTLSDDFIAKVALSFEGAKNVTALRTTLLDAIKTNTIDKVEVPTCETEKELQYEATEQLSQDFIDTLDNCADTRHHIDSKLWPELRLLGDAFCHLTKEPYGTFKHLLDLWHYRHGGWPKATTPPRIWSTIFRFMHEYDMLEQYGFDMASSWCKRMGLETKRTLASPTMFNFTAEAAAFGKYFMAKLKQDHESNYPQYKFEPYLHIIANGGKFFAYIWDTREIIFTGDSADLKIDDLTTDYADSCQPLWSDSIEITKLAEELIPDACKPIQPETYDDNDEFEREEVPVEMPEPQDFNEAVEQRKSELAAQFTSPEAKAAIGTDAMERYKVEHAHPEDRYDDDYNVQWHNGDRCYSEILGEGYVTGANEETGEIIIHFYRYDLDLPMWMWHLTKIEEPQKAE